MMWIKVIGDLAIITALTATAISLQLLIKTIRELSSDVLAVREDILRLEARLEAELSRRPPGAPPERASGPGALS